MIFFGTKKDFNLQLNRRVDISHFSLNFRHIDAKMSLNSIYLGSIIETGELDKMSKDNIVILDTALLYPLITAKELGSISTNHVSQMLSNKENTFRSTYYDLSTQLDEIKKDAITLAFIGCFGGGIGDMLASMPAFRLFVDTLKKHFNKVTIDLYSYALIGDIFTYVNEFFAHEEGVRDIKYLPLSVETLNTYDAFVDTTHFMQDAQSTSLPMVDFSLRKLGLEHDKIPTSQKAYYQEHDKKSYEFLFQDKQIEPLVKEYLHELAKSKKIVLFHPTASAPERSLPKELSNTLMAFMLNHPDIFVISVANFTHFSHERFLDISHLSRSTKHFCSIVANCDLCVSVDTGAFHIAQVAGVPSIVFFTAVEPLLRTKYYKNIYPISLGLEASGDEKYEEFDLNEFVEVFNKLTL